MSMADYSLRITEQRRFFASGKARSLAFRLAALKDLKGAIERHEQALCEALAADLGKPPMEAVIAETTVTIREIDHVCRHLKHWAAPQKVSTSLLNFPASAAISPEPLGVALIIGPWNYPLQLMLSPLVGALAAGNCALLKPSELAPHTAAAVSRLVAEVFDPRHVAVATGGPEVVQALLQERFDSIFFTGSARVARLVMAAAARHLTPVTLELGGKSPAIVDADADLAVAARRILWGKCFNAGQTCVAPDYLLVHVDVKEELLRRMTEQITAFFGADPQQSPDFARIINPTHFARLIAYLNDGKIVAGGQHDASACYLAPTILDHVFWDAPVMQEEIFGPILPVMTFTDEDDLAAQVARHPTPLALYYFSRDPVKQRRITARIPFGGGCVNDTLVHLVEHKLPFGGVGSSGLGRYHGRASFETFSHRKGVLNRGTWFDLPLRYPPYAGKLTWLKRLFRWF